MLDRDGEGDDASLICARLTISLYDANNGSVMSCNLIRIFAMGYSF